MFFKFILKFSTGELAVGIIVLVLACCFGILAFGDFLLLVRVRISFFLCVSI